ncbi:MAG: monofunctional biosynthetic peptidoglycan transglycosylase [Sphingobacteriaceae bacterium]|jgi:monofunctional biosynthetic peptidoglycan transglycosylase
MLKKTYRFFRKLMLYFFIGSVALTIIYRFVPPPFTYLMIQRLVEQKMDGEGLKLRKDWVSIGEMSPYLVRAVIASEDQHFNEHWGFDIEALQKAYQHNQKSKKVKGGSTISQQVAKNVFLWPGRSYFRKGLEAYFTILIEITWSKKRIMEIYLNEIEMGDGIYGAEAAAKKYFRKSAKDLSKRESALIAAVLPNPIRWTPVHPNAYIQRRQYRILRAMRYVGKPEYLK